MSHYVYGSGQFEDYCPNCERLTTHEVVKDDEVFEHAAVCTNCNMTWEYEGDPIREVNMKLPAKS